MDTPNRPHRATDPSGLASFGLTTDFMQSRPSAGLDQTAAQMDVQSRLSPSPQQQQQFGLYENDRSSPQQHFGLYDNDRGSQQQQLQHIPQQQQQGLVGPLSQQQGGSQAEQPHTGMYLPQPVQPQAAGSQPQLTRERFGLHPPQNGQQQLQGGSSHPQQTEQFGLPPPRTSGAGGLPP
eukprot:scaffold22917_cov14-Tisochrysis_lutea.AAC.1